MYGGLQCLSAISPFPTLSWRKFLQKLRVPSSVPFGNFPVPDKTVAKLVGHGAMGLQCLSAISPFPTRHIVRYKVRPQPVFSAFRQFPRSRQVPANNGNEAYSLWVFSAFRQFPRSRPTHKPRVIKNSTIVFSAFRQFPRSRHYTGLSGPAADTRVFSAFRQFPRSRLNSTCSSYEKSSFGLQCLSAISPFPTKSGTRNKTST